jgi:hypothetical protein
MWCPWSLFWMPTESQKGGDDAKKAVVLPLEDLPFDKIVFDHAKILKDFLRCP